MENQASKKHIPGDESDYLAISNKKAFTNAAYRENILLKSAAKTITVTSKEKATIEKFTAKQNRNLPAVPIIHQGRSYQQTVSDKIYEDDTVKRRQVYGTKKIITEKASIIPGQKENGMPFKQTKITWWHLCTKKNVKTLAAKQKTTPLCLVIHYPL